MINKDEALAMRAIALCFKPFLKPEEACIYCNLGRTQLGKRLEEYGVPKTSTGYYKREDLDKMMAGAIMPLAVGSIDQRIEAFKKQVRQQGRR